MKQFLVISVLVFMMLISGIDDVVENAKYSKDSKYFTKSDGEYIYIAKDDSWEKLNIIGVNLDPTKPGIFPGENKVTEEEYFRWIKNIYDMGSNCIKVSNLMSNNFYKALEQFNKDKSEPIYLMQGIYFDEEYLKDGYDPQEKDLKEIFKKNIKLTVDSVHGNPQELVNIDETKFYNTNISEYVIGYTLGIEFASHDLIYTEIMNEKIQYNGKYVYTDKNSSSFESYMAHMADYLADYELETYDKQSILSFIGSGTNSIVMGEKDTESDKTQDSSYKEEYLNPENIKAKKKFKPGIVASYNIYPSYSMLNEHQGDLYGYLVKINEYHKIPILINEIGVPSSRMSGDFNENFDKGYITEKEQGESLIKILNDVEKAKFAGSFIADFQDSWYRSSSNTKDNNILGKSPMWSDAQTTSQNFGLTSFDPGKNTSVCYVDNNIDEWKDRDIINQNEDISLSMKSDEKYVYFMSKSKGEFNFSKNDLYIDLDITPKSGSNKSSKYGLKFEKPVDFIINIKDKNNSSILVHEYYNKFDFENNKYKYKQRPDMMNYTSDMDVFSPVYIETRPKMYVKGLGKDVEQLSYETGKLVHGNSNPKSKNFNSVADYFIAKDYVEIRIPWGLLNFMDPSTNQIQDDFYKELKTKALMINKINVGLTQVKDNVVVSRLSNSSYNLDSWVIPKYNERLKQSYYILQKELTK